MSGVLLDSRFMSGARLRIANAAAVSETWTFAHKVTLNSSFVSETGIFAHECLEIHSMSLYPHYDVLPAGVFLQLYWKCEYYIYICAEAHINDCVHSSGVCPDGGEIVIIRPVGHFVHTSGISTIAEMAKAIRHL